MSRGMLPSYETAENITGIADTSGVSIFHPTELTQDCDKCNSSHEASSLIPFPWHQRFKALIGARKVEGTIEFNVCSDCHEFLKSVHRYDITAHIDEHETSGAAEYLTPAA